MQVMPGTWSSLRTSLSLGEDPFDPHDNILAGATYLRWMRDRYGEAGFLAAYNAGPARYDEHLATGRPLPAETRNYVASVSAQLALSLPDNIAIGAPLAPSCRLLPSFRRRSCVRAMRPGLSAVRTTRHVHLVPE